MVAHSSISRTRALYAIFLCLLVAGLEVAPEEAECLVGFVGDGVDTCAAFHVILDVDSEVIC